MKVFLVLSGFSLFVAWPPVQTVFQMLAGIDLPIPALITKVFIFIILAAFALYFDRKLSKIILSRNVEETSQ